MNLIISVALICAGWYVLYEEYLRPSGLHGRAQPFVVGLILFASGVYWLWLYVIGDIVLEWLIRHRG
jgi:hypothetical protein